MPAHAIPRHHFSAQGPCKRAPWAHFLPNQRRNSYNRQRKRGVAAARTTKEFRSYKRTARPCSTSYSLLQPPLFGASASVVVKDAVDAVSPAWLMGMRFVATAAGLAVVFHKTLRANFDTSHLFAGVVLGILSFLGFLDSNYRHHRYNPRPQRVSYRDVLRHGAFSLLDCGEASPHGI